MVSTLAASCRLPVRDVSEVDCPAREYPPQPARGNEATSSPAPRSDAQAGVLMPAPAAAVRRAIRDYHRLGTTIRKGDPKVALCVGSSWGYVARFHHPPTTPSATRQRRSVDGSGTAAVPPPTMASTNGSTSNPSTAPSPFMSAGAS
jgi:hypothetical protein